MWRARGIHVCSASSYIIAFLVMLYMLHCSDTVHTYSYCDWTFHALFHLFQSMYACIFITYLYLILSCNLSQCYMNYTS